MISNNWVEFYSRMFEMELNSSELRRKDKLYDLGLLDLTYLASSNQFKQHTVKLKFKWADPICYLIFMWVTDVMLANSAMGHEFYISIWEAGEQNIFIKQACEVSYIHVGHGILYSQQPCMQTEAEPGGPGRAPAPGRLVPVTLPRG